MLVLRPRPVQMQRMDLADLPHDRSHLLTVSRQLTLLNTKLRSLRLSPTNMLIVLTIRPTAMQQMADDEAWRDDDELRLHVALHLSQAAEQQVDVIPGQGHQSRQPAQERAHHGLPGPVETGAEARCAVPCFGDVADCDGTGVGDGDGGGGDCRAAQE